MCIRCLSLLSQSHTQICNARPCLCAHAGPRTVNAPPLKSATAAAAAAAAGSSTGTGAGGPPRTSLLQYVVCSALRAGHAGGSDGAAIAALPQQLAGVRAAAGIQVSNIAALVAELRGGYELLQVCFVCVCMPACACVCARACVRVRMLMLEHAARVHVRLCWCPSDFLQGVAACCRGRRAYCASVLGAHQLMHMHTHAHKRRTQRTHTTCTRLHNTYGTWCAKHAGGRRRPAC